MREKILSLSLAFLVLFCVVSNALCSSNDADGKKKFLIVSSYHREYPWSMDTNEGVLAALLKFGYIDNDEQVAEFMKNDEVESSKAAVKKLWMNTKKKKSSEEIASAVSKITKIAKDFKPDIILLGDDNAAKYIGSQYLDTDVPIVFWGVNNTPVKYGLVDSIEKPGHNVTGVYQTGYQQESLELLKRIVPSIKTFAILSDDTITGRARLKQVERLAHKNIIEIELVETVVENSFKEWKEKALLLQEKVDAFFIAQYSGLINEEGSHVSVEEVVAWYTKNIKIPEAVGPSSAVKLGMLCSADDSGYNHGFSAIEIAHDILENGKAPKTYPPITPKRGALMVNKKRGESLGITFTKEMGIEEYL